MTTTIQIHDQTFEILIQKENIEKRIRLMGIQLNLDYEKRCPIFIGILNGCFLFMADLLKEVSIPCEVAFVKVSSYKGTNSSGKIKETLGLPEDLHNRDIILVEDIVDTGFTLGYLLQEIQKQKPASVKVCSLLLKPDALKVPIEALEYVGFEIANEFVVGYGLDYDGLGRNLTDIYSVKTVLPALAEM
jgi:hypoxanthine phosphoribosyltransferase